MRWSLKVSSGRPVLALSSSETSGKLYSLSEPQGLHVENGDGRSKVPRRVGVKIKGQGRSRRWALGKVLSQCATCGFITVFWTHLLWKYAPSWFKSIAEWAGVSPVTWGWVSVLQENEVFHPSASGATPRRKDQTSRGEPVGCWLDSALWVGPAKAQMTNKAHL